jgi:hypothetical protein
VILTTIAVAHPSHRSARGKLQTAVPALADPSAAPTATMAMAMMSLEPDLKLVDRPRGC